MRFEWEGDRVVGLLPRARGESQRGVLTRLRSDESRTTAENRLRVFAKNHPYALVRRENEPFVEVI